MLSNNKSEVEGNHNIVIQNVSDSTITLNVGGEVKEIDRKLEELLSLLEKLSQNSFQSADKTYKVETISHANFDFILNQAVFAGLPYEVKENASSADNWALSLSQELVDLDIAVNNNTIFSHYGWLIEVFLQKMSTEVGKATTLRALSFMTEAYQASLYYLCVIQLAQIIQKNKITNPIFTDFFKTTPENQVLFDFQQLLLLGAEALGDENFVPEIVDFVEELSDTNSDLYNVVLYLDKIRRQLIHNQINDDSSLPQLLEDYRTALIFWLRKLTFIAKYRLVSMKEINIRYKLGATSKEFIHLYGELHGIYDNLVTRKDYTQLSIKDIFTFNQSVLLFKGTHIPTTFKEMYKNQNDIPYISLSPFIIDQSVFSEKITQTPEIYNFGGMNGKNYHFVNFKNELPTGEQKN
ncbi:hypothetical protein [Flectobacillus sp. BAB-3569]|uniref:hypothetical protein n=1 Tax=Flectobacillus sp. BAB-3569 TaxID=1509483 RepID=UPI000BA44036|nr:hypothetical protein [Flectobacillus sp. BAB-3569]PAC26985.1 hypothetical protein BWI92_23990 [Flectobacillus sp. BAB-3569]